MRPFRKLAGFATSTKHIVGGVLAIVALGLSFIGVVSAVVALGIAVAVYAVGARVAPARRGPVLVGGTDVRVVRRALASTQRKIAGRVTNDISVKVDRITRRIGDTLDRADALGGGSYAQFVLAKCATDYLPDTLDAYLRLPRAYADHHEFADGRTPRVLLIEQLDVLQREMDAIAAAANGAQAEQLIVNGRFLFDKFPAGTPGGPSDMLD
jgi:hypothetical protein